MHVMRLADAADAVECLVFIGIPTGILNHSSVRRFEGRTDSSGLVGTHEDMRLSQ